MIVSTTDPISMHDVSDLEHHPYIIEGKGETALKIYFESEATKREYINIKMEETGGDFESKLDNPN